MSPGWSVNKWKFMSVAGKPENEVERLRALGECQVLDTGPELVYDDITRLLALTCDMPMAVISLLDEDRDHALVDAVR